MAFTCEKECFRVELNRNFLRTAFHGYAVHCDDADDSGDDGLEDAICIPFGKGFATTACDGCGSGSFR